MMYKRILLKLSGEALGEKGWLFDHEKILEVAGILKEIRDGGTQVGVPQSPTRTNSSSPAVMESPPEPPAKSLAPTARMTSKASAT